MTRTRKLMSEQSVFWRVRNNPSSPTRASRNRDAYPIATRVCSGSAVDRQGPTNAAERREGIGETGGPDPRCDRSEGRTEALMRNASAEEVGGLRRIPPRRQRHAVNRVSTHQQDMWRSTPVATKPSSARPCPSECHQPPPDPSAATPVGAPLRAHRTADVPSTICGLPSPRKARNVTASVFVNRDSRG